MGWRAGLLEREFESVATIQFNFNLHEIGIHCNENICFTNQSHNLFLNNVIKLEKPFATDIVK